jgi:hypothetical protein
MRMHWRWIFILFVLVIVVLGAGLLTQAEDPAQVSASATPARISIPSPIPLASEIAAATPTEMPTPTPIGAILLEAANEANVRSSPDIGAEKMGTIRTGEIYSIIGRSFRWLQFQYDASPSGTGWVYDELVNIIGNPDDIVDLNANILPTVDTSSINATQTWEAIQQTPGGLLTATADSRIIQVPGSGDTSISGRPAAGQMATVPLLPTFTYPPDVISQPPSLNTPEDTQPIANTDNLAEVVNDITPITPILIFGVFGILGLLLSSMRRG